MRRCRIVESCAFSSIISYGLIVSQIGNLRDILVILFVSDIDSLCTAIHGEFIVES